MNRIKDYIIASITGGFPLIIMVPLLLGVGLSYLVPSDYGVAYVFAAFIGGVFNSLWLGVSFSFLSFNNGKIRLLWLCVALIIFETLIFLSIHFPECAISILSTGLRNIDIPDFEEFLSLGDFKLRFIIISVLLPLLTLFIYKEIYFQSKLRADAIKGWCKRNFRELMLMIVGSYIIPIHLIWFHNPFL